MSPTSKTYSGFTSPEIQTIIINQKGTTINYYYVRNKYQYTLGECDGVLTTGSTPSGQYYYGSTIVLKANVKDGYLWSKWSNEDSNMETTLSMPASELNITPIATKNSDTITEGRKDKTPQNGATIQIEDDNTMAPGVLPQTGKTEKTLFIILILIIASIILYKKNKKI